MLATHRPIINIRLPPPIQVSTPQLFGIHAALLCFDFSVIRWEKSYGSALRLTPLQLRLMLAILHVLVPLTFSCQHELTAASLVGTPWFLASYGVFFADQESSLVGWVTRFRSVLLSLEKADSISTKTGSIRLLGLAKVCRGIFKWAFIKAAIDPWLPPSTQVLLHLPYWSISSLKLTLLLGVKAYCLLGSMDIILGLQQWLLALQTIDMFDSPVLAYSPRDFWSRRWNRLVHKVFHQQLFYCKQQKVQQEQKQDMPPKRSATNILFSSPNLRGLFVFLISGVFHELLLMALVRRMTLEQVLFFMLHGLTVLGEVQLTRHQLFYRDPPTDPARRVLCILVHMTFLTLTGRLFLAPYLRDDYFTYYLNP